MATFTALHEWNLEPTAAVELQKQLRERVRLTPLEKQIETIAGADISFNKYEPTIYAGIIVLQLPSLEIIERAGVVTETAFPYVPGLLSFREIPPLLQVWETLKTTPDAIMLDGQGTAHPRRMGIACHFGLIVERPTIGCAKTLLTGKYEEPAPERGAWTPLVDKKQTVGAALRTKNKTAPVYISPGHLIDLPGAIDIALKCNGGYRIPEPTRQAHLMVNRLRRGEEL